MQHFIDLLMQVDPGAASHVGMLGWLVLRVEMLHRRDRAQNRRIRALEQHTGLTREPLTKVA